MTVRRLLAIVFGIVVVLVLGRGWLMARGLNEIHRDTRALNEKSLHDSQAVSRALKLTLDLQAGIRAYVITTDPAARAPYDRALERLEPTTAELRRRLAGSAGGRVASEDFIRELSAWNQAVGEPLARDPRPTSVEAHRAIQADSQRRIELMRRLLERARDAVEAEEFAALESLEDRRYRLATKYIGTTALYLVVLLIGWLLSSRMINRPLAALATYAARGTTDAPPAVTGVREVVELREAMNTMRLRLEEKHSLLNTTLGAALEGIVLVDQDDICVLANPAAKQLTGYDLTGKSSREIWDLLSATPVDPEDAAELAEEPGRHSRSDLAYRIRDRDGRERILSVNMAALPDGRTVLSGRDVTVEHELRERLAALNEDLQGRNLELSSQEEELRAQSEQLSARNEALIEASRAKTEFLATMSHELRTPLNAVIGFSEILLDGTYGAVSDKQATALNHVHEAGRHLLRLIDDLLDLSKIEAGRVALATTTFEVGAAISDAVTLVAASAEAKRIHLEISVPPIHIRADRARVRQIALNLLSNAIKFTPAEGTVEVTTAIVGSRVRVAVRDTGIGIRSEDGDKLFKAFSQLETGDRRRFGGTGLGLSISKHLAEVMDGSVGYTSEPGVGSTFWFELPLAQPSAGAAVTLVPARDVSKRPVAPPRILVVEDSETDGTVIETVLSQAGYEVHVARDAELALQRINNEPPALALVDLALPGMSGFALIEKLRGNPRFATLPIGVLTGRDLSAEERAQLEARVQFIERKGAGARAGFLSQIAALVPAGAVPVQRPLVLVIDDNEINRSVASAMVEALGYDSIEAADAETGIRLAKDRNPAVILMDIEMPGMNGLQATRALRADSMTTLTPIIALTAHAMAGDAERFLAEGCTDYVSKPFGRVALRRALARALGAPDAT